MSYHIFALQEGVDTELQPCENDWYLPLEILSRRYELGNEVINKCRFHSIYTYKVLLTFEVSSV